MKSYGNINITITKRAFTIATAIAIVTTITSTVTYGQTHGNGGYYDPYRGYIGQSPGSNPNTYRGMPQTSSGGGGGAGQPYFDAARQINNILMENIRRNNEAINNTMNNNQGYGSELTRAQVQQQILMDPSNQRTPAQIAGEQRAIRQQQIAAQKEAVRLQKQQAAEEKLVQQGYEKADRSVAVAQEAALRRYEAQESWKKASNNIWRKGEKDPWGNFRKRLENWEANPFNVMARPDERPTLNADGEITTRKEMNAESDQEWLETIKSPNARKRKN